MFQRRGVDYSSAFFAKDKCENCKNFEPEEEDIHDMIIVKVKKVIKDGSTPKYIYLGRKEQKMMGGFGDNDRLYVTPCACSLKLIKVNKSSHFEVY